ncbi:hypothetical protein THAOC_06211 [Thalassiosira oceanica]|uniref:Uncharacterized protein n=1 Tax=Thalassiosira oceanica TaxID=159749 RepID=K0T3J7_THAOC|nr:hypothetical protein THAOC_06211 [Thalassiosira oceanica]|eukprot:EJK72270.1 hypothetical protein THAOC_06211 [Thalassiosira oceanica]
MPPTSQRGQTTTTRRRSPRRARSGRPEGVEPGLHAPGLIAGGRSGGGGEGTPRKPSDGVGASPGRPAGPARALRESVRAVTALGGRGNAADLETFAGPRMSGQKKAPAEIGRGTALHASVRLRLDGPLIVDRPSLAMHGGRTRRMSWTGEMRTASMGRGGGDGVPYDLPGRDRIGAGGGDEGRASGRADGRRRKSPAGSAGLLEGRGNDALPREAGEAGRRRGTEISLPQARPTWSTARGKSRSREGRWALECFCGVQRCERTPHPDGWEGVRLRTATETFAAEANRWREQQALADEWETGHYTSKAPVDAEPRFWGKRGWRQQVDKVEGEEGSHGDATEAKQASSAIDRGGNIIDILIHEQTK